MNDIKIWFLENRLPSMFAGIVLLCSGAVGWMTSNAWDDYSKASQTLTKAVEDLSKIGKKNPPPSESNLLLVKKNLEAEQAALNELSKSLKAYRIPAFGNLEKSKPQDRPQMFQDALRAQVTSLKTLAATSGCSLAPGFYLGLGEYENKLPSPEAVMSLAGQLTVLDWAAKKLLSHQGLILAEFERVATQSSQQGATGNAAAKVDRKPPLPAFSASSNQSSWISPGSIKASFRCDQSSFRDIVNALSGAPYFLIIESLQLQNSVMEPPRRGMPPPPDQPQPQQPGTKDPTSSSQRLPIVVGREQINVSMRIRILDFPEASRQGAPSTSTK